MDRLYLRRRSDGLVRGHIRFYKFRFYVFKGCSKLLTVRNIEVFPSALARDALELVLSFGNIKPNYVYGDVDAVLLAQPPSDSARIAAAAFHTVAD